MTGVDQRKTQFIALVERYCQLGCLLPAVEDINTDDDARWRGSRRFLRRWRKPKLR